MLPSHSPFYIALQFLYWQTSLVLWMWKVAGPREIWLSGVWVWSGRAKLPCHRHVKQWVKSSCASNSLVSPKPRERAAVKEAMMGHRHHVHMASGVEWVSAIFSPERWVVPCRCHIVGDLAWSISSTNPKATEVTFAPSSWAFSNDIKTRYGRRPHDLVRCLMFTTY